MAQVQLFSAFSCTAAGIIIVLSFIAMLSMIVMSSLSDQYGCRTFYTSAVIDGQPQSTSSDNIVVHFTYTVAIHISSAVMQSA